MSKLAELYSKEVLSGGINIDEVPIKLRKDVAAEMERQNAEKAGE